MSLTTWRHGGLKIGIAVALVIILYVVSGVVTGVHADTTPSPPGGDYADQCADGSNPTFDNGKLTFTYQPKISSNDHCLKFSSNGGAPVGSAEVTSGDEVTIKGFGGWLPNRSLQIWQSDPLPIQVTGRTWPLYLTSNISIGPDKDINRECRVIIKGNEANPISTYNQALPTGNDLMNYEAFPEVVFKAPEVTTESIVNIQVSIPNPNCTGIGSAGSNEQSADALLIVQPRPPVAQQCQVKTTGPCLLINDSSVVYPGNKFNVSGYNFQSIPNALGKSVSFFVTPGLNAKACQVAKGTTNLVSATKIDTANFTQDLLAPPAPSLVKNIFQNGVYTYTVIATTDPTCNDSAQMATATLYVVPSVLTVPSQLTAQQSDKFVGASWLGSTVTNATQPLNLGIYVGDRNNFNCATAKKFTTTSGMDGTFSVPYTAPDITADSGVDYQVRVVAYPSTTTLPDNACQQYDSSTCLAAQSDATCPLITAFAPLRVVPKPSPVPPWVPILLSLLTLLCLLLLLLLLTRRDEKELVVTIEDITKERDVVNVNAPSAYAEALYTRTIRETKTLYRLKDKKVLDQEVAEYDVFRDAQGREVQRLRPVDRTTLNTLKRQPVTAGS